MNRSRLWLVITLLLAILTGLLVFRYLNGGREAAVDEVMTTQVVAKAKIPAGAKITAEMLDTVKVPVRYAQPSAARDPKTVVNQFALTELAPGDVVSSTRIATEKAVNELPYKVPAGYRAVTVPVNALTGVAGLLKPGHYVDVILTYRATDRLDDARAVTLVQNALVLAVGSDLQKKEAAQNSDNVTLALVPHDAELVALGESIGRLKLAARPAGDEAKPVLPYVDPARMLKLFP